jgi:hypothetical protein
LLPSTIMLQIYTTEVQVTFFWPRISCNALYALGHMLRYQVKQLVSGDMSQRHETPIHPSTFYVKMSQEEVLLTFKTRSFSHCTFIAGPATRPLCAQAKRDPLMFPHVAASQPITGHVYRHNICCGTRCDLSRHIKQLCPDKVCRNICALVRTGLNTLSCSMQL